MNKIKNIFLEWKQGFFQTEYKLKHQLWIISLSSILASIIFLLVFLPRILTPFYENNLYDYLSGPLDFVGMDITQSEISTNVAFILVTKDNIVLVSRNIHKIIKTDDYNKIVDKIKNGQGSIYYKDQTYYYSAYSVDGGIKIAITDDSYIQMMKAELSSIILPTIIVSFSIITALLLFWNSHIVRKVECIKRKMDNIDNKKDKEKIHFEINDELSSLLGKVEETKLKLIENEEYKTQILQNISHELKTPITVIKSYIEGVGDQVISEKEALKIIDAETDRLQRLVESLLYINKIDYYSDNITIKNQKINLNLLIHRIMNKYKKMKKNITFEFESEKEESLFTGNEEMWEIVFENLFSNAIRYAESKIRVSIHKNVLRFYNDGKSIDEKLLKKVLQPYEKGNDGQFGLGLTIIHKTVLLFGYTIKINNLEKGVEFIIK